MAQPETNQEPQKIRARAAAKRYSVGLSTIWLYAKQKKIKPHKVSDNVTVFDVAELNKFFSNSVSA